jgi:hypothetical protein
MKLLLAILLLCNIGLCQQPCDHESNDDKRFAKIRLLPPVKITVNGNTIETIHKDRFGTYIGNYAIDKDSIVPKIDKGKLYWVLVCIECKHVYLAALLTPEQMK